MTYDKPGTPGRYLVWKVAGDNDPVTGGISGEGIELNHSSGHVVAYNSITRTADGVSYPDRNCDIYGNDIFDVSDDGLGFVIGIEHWCLYDPAVSNWCDSENFGLATLQDNAYDGVEARRTPGTDSRGYAAGGEEADYGNLLGPLSGFLRRIDDRLRQ